MKRVSDKEKLIKIAIEYAMFRKTFTSRMLFDYILDSDIKFKKSINNRSIGFALSSNPLFRKLEKKKNIQYYTLNEEEYLKC